MEIFKKTVSLSCIFCYPFSELDFKETEQNGKKFNQMVAKREQTLKSFIELFFKFASKIIFMGQSSKGKQFL